MSSVLNFDVEWTKKVCEACGVNALEFNHHGAEGRRPAELEALRKEYEDAGIVINSFHLPFAADDDIASFYESQRRGAVHRMNRWIEVAGLLGSKVVIQHPTTNRYRAEDNGIDRYFEQLYKSLEEMVPVARDAGVIIGLENMTPGTDRGRFMSEAEHFRRVAKEFTDPNVGFVYDTGHALLSAGERAHDILEAMGERVAAWHMADNPGDRDAHLAPGRGEVDWDGVFQFAARIGFSQPMTMETAPWGPGPDYSVETWKRTIEALDELVERALRMTA